MSKEKPAFDLSALDTAKACDAPFKLELLHPVSKEGLGCGVMLVGKDSPSVKDHVRKNANARLRKDFMAKRKGKGDEAITIEQIEAEAIDYLVTCTTDFWGNLLVDGAALSYSPANAKALYERFSWAREQVDDAIGDLENFIKA